MIGTRFIDLALSCNTVILHVFPLLEQDKIPAFCRLVHGCENLQWSINCFVDNLVFTDLVLIRK